jgi:antitoxin (DNA-binding transcriptional repressor) of toxin-antitoxin stability system
MRRLGTTEVERELAAVLDAAERGEQTVVLRQGRPIAVIAPYTEWSSQRPWLLPTIRTIGELLDLPEGWSSYPARRIDPAAAIWALDLLGKVMQPETPAPTVLPTARGELELEWHLRGIDLEVHLVSPTRVYFYFEDRRSGRIEEHELDGDLSPLAEALAELTRR